ncbi:helix-turn-helix domain-containing protein [Saccharothrix coeruleofusca]|uniref:Transcriptional regulator n=1 Tax=Saccharothrix coeruleofusca TaxID=33919 RepID=A0A918EEU8_9PSEU|nr:helix-turn-helix transcriptional regulator [Saccharothrix coeruleofusca]MBP2340794.1 transcriptional regulator with XRE-family HTH domain [Saccharothrix coeruleofusca]GGP59878.1 transcriptional regulator [Saccharothrix coeruleofusca]
MAVANPLRVELGQRLRAYRERACLRTQQVETDPVLRWHVGKVSRVELGQRVPTIAETHRLAELYGVKGDELTALVDLASRARKRARMPHVPDWAQSFVLLEQAAHEIDYHDAELIPAVLQAPGYARDLLGQSTTEDLDQRVADRLTRGQVLTGQGAPRVRVVLGEAALHRLPADHRAAAEQLEHLLEAGTWPTVEVRVLPFSLGLHPMVGVGFTVLRVRDPEVHRVYIDGATTATYLHEPAEIAVYQTRFERLWTMACAPDESATIVSGRIRQLG